MARGERCVLWDKVALGRYDADNVNNAIHNRINGRGARKGGRAKR